MPIIYLKSGGYVECEGYTIKDGVVKTIGATFKETTFPPKETKQQESVIPLSNILFILPQKVLQ
ncbi:MAG: hypothetical protein N2201_06190 [candidate division WOR-3 bacterium]|nr:hypothetical protein [candidate division WOR-3 bacterium]